MTGTINGASSPIKVTDTLPANETVTSVEASTGSGIPGREGGVPLACESKPGQVTCSYEGVLPPYVQLLLVIKVKVEGEPPAGAENRLKVEGGATPAKALARPVDASPQPTPFGVESFEVTPEEEGGAPDQQAGSHPFQLATTVDFNQSLITTRLGVFPWAPAPLKDVRTVLPPGLVGATTTVKQCSDADFATVQLFDLNPCPADTAIGVVVVTFTEPKILTYRTVTRPLFNLAPAAGEPARFGFLVESVPIVLDTALRTGEGYPVEARVNNASETVSVLDSQIFVWGVPGDPRHDNSRGWECLAETRQKFESRLGIIPTCNFGERHPLAFLTLPTACGSDEATLLVDSWTEPGGQLFGGRADPSDARWKQARAALPPLEGCDQLPFDPSIAVSSDEHVANTPTGMTVEVSLPQDSTLSGTGLGGGRAPREWICRSACRRAAAPPTAYETCSTRTDRLRHGRGLPDTSALQKPPRRKTNISPPKRRCARMPQRSAPSTSRRPCSRAN